MTRQEQIEEMAVIGCVRNPQAHTAEECAKCDFKQGKCNAYRHAEKLYDAGYRKVDDFEAEDERLREVIRQLNTDYNRAWERLKSDCREIGELKAENKQLKTECALLDDELRIARQDTVNVLNELKGNIKNAIDTYYNSQGGGYYLAEDVINDIDELLKEYE